MTNFIIEGYCGTNAVYLVVMTTSDSMYYFTVISAWGGGLLGFGLLLKLLRGIYSANGSAVGDTR